MPPASSSSSSPPSQEPLKFISLPPKSRHSATVFFIHGLGDTGHGWKPVADMFRLDPALSHVKWILPHSPVRAVQANLGMEMPSWFDIYSFGFNTNEDEVGMIQSARSINQLIMNEVESGMDPSRIILGGFSQGATMSLLTGMMSELKLGGIIVLSGWLTLRSKFKEATSTPVFWGQGAQDSLVKSAFGRESADFLVTELGMPVGVPNECRGLSFITYDNLGHATNPMELDDVCNWLKKAIPAEKARK
ncbi:Phospholipase/carboxylesterase [Pleurotus eryngii]|uniref:Acyl-protein thioesterase 1 n=1 Tax=Pleurotus eryngii TaxID=5323 RepID=A0A9P6A6Q0_PLEER|nr:Phospholipase/carboxylesterase [Pleurotus eryngii]